MHKTGKRHAQSRYSDETRRQILYFLRGLIKHGKERCQDGKYAPQNQAGDDGKNYQLRICLPCFLHFTGTQKLPHNNGNRTSQSQKDYIKKIGDCGRDIQSGNCIQSPVGIALHQESNSGRPKNLIDHKRCAFYDNISGQLHGNLWIPVNSRNERHFACMSVCPDDHNCRLNIPGDHCGNRCPLYSQLRESEIAENQQIIQSQIHQYRCNAGFHGNHRFSAFP